MIRYLDLHVEVESDTSFISHLLQMYLVHGQIKKGKYKLANITKL